MASGIVVPARADTVYRVYQRPPREERRKHRILQRLGVVRVDDVNLVVSNEATKPSKRSDRHEPPRRRCVTFPGRQVTECITVAPEPANASDGHVVARCREPVREFQDHGLKTADRQTMCQLQDSHNMTTSLPQLHHPALEVVSVAGSRSCCIMVPKRASAGPPRVAACL